MGTRFDSEIRPDRTAPKDTVTALEPRTESSAAAPSASAGPIRSLRRADQAADHRAAAGHHGPDDVPRRSAACPSLWLVVATLVGGTLVGRRGQHAQLLPRPRHRRGHAPHRATARWSPARSSPRGGPASSASCSAVAVARSGSGCWSTGCQRLARARRDRSSTSSSTRCCSSGAPSQNIVWGGAAGCMPVLIGWSAVTGSLSLGGARALRRHLLLDAAALLAAVDAVQGRLRRRPGVPMLPVVAEDFVGRAPGRPSTPGRWSPRRWCWSRSPAWAGLPRGRRRRRRGLPARGAPAARPGQGAGASDGRR